MSIHLDVCSQKSASSDPFLHHVPAEIKYDGEAKVSEYFTTGIRKDHNTTDGLTASFRGRPLHGTKIGVPEGYTGLVLKELHKPFSEDEEREFRITHQFTEYTSWNLDLPPSSHDKIQQALQWTNIASAVHSPVVDKSSPKSDTSR